MKVKVYCIGGIILEFDTPLKSPKDLEDWQKSQTGWITINGKTKTQMIQLSNVSAFEVEQGEANYV